MKTIKIPTDLTAEEAFSIAALLDQILNAINSGPTADLSDGLGHCRRTDPVLTPETATHYAGQPRERQAGYDSHESAPWMSPRGLRSARRPNGLASQIDVLPGGAFLVFLIYRDANRDVVCRGRYPTRRANR